jgi:hypothetical protein
MILAVLISLSSDRFMVINAKTLKRGFFMVKFNLFFTLFKFNNTFSELQLATGKHKYNLYTTSTLGNAELS